MPMLVNDQDRKHYEVAARIYCNRIGENPDDRVPFPHPKIANEMIQGRVWWLAADKLHDLSMMLTSLKDAAVAKEKAGILTDQPDPGGPNAKG